MTKYAKTTTKERLCQVTSSLMTSLFTFKNKVMYETRSVRSATHLLIKHQRAPKTDEHWYCRTKLDFSRHIFWITAAFVYVQEPVCPSVFHITALVHA